MKGRNGDKERIDIDDAYESYENENRKEQLYD